MQPSPARTSPRKIPRQARARATVDAIVEAVAQVLVEHGYEKTTTARVAERAGVSIGSLYQYFPSKEALVAELIERHADQLVATLRRLLVDATHASLAEAVKAAIDAAFSAHRIDPALHKILHEQVPRVGRLGKAMDASREIARAIEACLRLHANEISPHHDLATAAVVIETAVDALAHKAVLERRSPLSREAASRAAFSLVLNYLQQPAACP